MKTWQEIKAEIDHETEITSLAPVRDVVDVFKHGISKGGAGLPHDNQIFTTWYYGGPDVTYITDWCYFLIELAKDEDFSIQELHRMARFWFVQPSKFGHYCGLYRQYELTKEIDAVMDTLNREAFVALLDSFRSYLANINVWVYQYMPWGVGYAFPRKDQSYYEAGLKLVSGK